MKRQIKMLKLKLRTFVQQKNIKRVKKQVREWEKILAIYKELIQIHKELI